VVGLTLLALLGLWSLRVTYQVNFVNQDFVKEYLFYAHASPDPLADMRQMEAISRRTVGDRQLKIAYDDDSSWPFNWYLSEWPNAVYYGASPSRETFADAPVVLVGSKNLDKARPFLQRDYQEFNRRLIWWPDEGYKNTSWEKIKLGISDPQKRREFLDVVLWRRFPTPMNQWPLVHRYSLFVRKDVAAQLWDFGAQPSALAPLVDPYEQGFREDWSSQQIIGSGLGAGARPADLPAQHGRGARWLDLCRRQRQPSHPGFSTPLATSCASGAAPASYTPRACPAVSIPTAPAPCRSATASCASRGASRWGRTATSTWPTPGTTASRSSTGRAPSCRPVGRLRHHRR
jgi:hypothetical protein